MLRYADVDTTNIIIIMAQRRVLQVRMSPTATSSSSSSINACACLPQHIQIFLREKLGNEIVRSVQVHEVKSAQQRVLILHFGGDVKWETLTDENWQQALVSGRNRLVVRTWMGANRWWNLNHANTVSNGWSEQLQQIAEQECWGYQSARRALEKERTAIRVPRIVHFSATLEEKYPWAIMEYVGKHSTIYDDSIFFDESWTIGMTKVREEFGFIEPHPRWGRVPVECSLKYAMMVLDFVILPLHRYYYSEKQCSSQTNEMKPLNYLDMAELYKIKYEAILIDQDAAEHSGSSDKLQDVIRTLGCAIRKLVDEATSEEVERPIRMLPPVLCHIDCQPQNLMFARRQRRDSSKEQEEDEVLIVSVLDWEEAAYADPRFELLMLCRKVCANKHQAEQVWQKYQEEMDGIVVLGPIEPWLNLEVVHSLTTLLLQATAGGGRCPWESKPDLWGKIERELHRLADLTR